MFLVFLALMVTSLILAIVCIARALETNRDRWFILGTVLIILAFVLMALTIVALCSEYGCENGGGGIIVVPIYIP